MNEFFETKKLKSILEERKVMTAQEMVEALGIEINRDNRKLVYQQVRKVMRQVVDINGGSREDKNDKGEQLYKVE